MLITCRGWEVSNGLHQAAQPVRPVFDRHGASTENTALASVDAATITLTDRGEPQACKSASKAGTPSRRQLTTDEIGERRLPMGA